MTKMLERPVLTFVVTLVVMLTFDSLADGGIREHSYALFLTMILFRKTEEW